ncbi:MAG: hypothetical protein J5930_09665 [Treponema sp.]|nr:hypothetical protein [Treponema sp.]
MKKIFMILVAALMTVTAVFAQGKPVVVVVPFDAKNVSQDDVDIISEVFQAEYTSTGKATVVDRGSFDKIKAQQKFELSDWSDSAKVTELGKSLNAHQIITGQISQFGSQLVISIKLTDVKTTELLATTTKRVANMDLLFDECSKLAKDLSLKAAIPVEYPIGSKGPAGGTVYAVEGDWRWEVSEVLSVSGKPNLENYFMLITDGYIQDWFPPTKSDAELIEKNLVKQGILLSNKALWVYDSSARGDSWDPSIKYYSFQNGSDSSTAVTRAVRKFNVNDPTKPQDAVIGMWKGSMELGDIGDKCFSSTNYDLASKLRDAVRNEFPLEVTLILEPDRTCKVYYYEITGTQTVDREVTKKNGEVIKSNTVRASVNLKKMDKCTWSKDYYGSYNTFYYAISDESGNIIASFRSGRYDDRPWRLTPDFPPQNINLRSIGNIQRTVYTNHWKRGFEIDKDTYSRDWEYIPIKKIQD